MHVEGMGARWPRMRFLLVALLFAASCSSGKSTTEPSSATVRPLIIHHGKFFGHAGAEALLVENGRIKALGGLDTLKAQAPSDVELLDAQGALVLPGFHDSHVHAMGAGMGSLGVDLSEHQTMDATLTALKKFAAEHPGDGWITGRGWQYGIVPAGQFPSRLQLDSAIPDRPVFVRSYDGHSGWANSLAFKKANVTAETKDPEGGKVVREADGKTPQGTLLEGGMMVMEGAVPPPAPEVLKSALEGALKHLMESGYTSVEEIAFDPGEVDLLASLEKAGRLPLRVHVSLPLSGDLDAYEAIRKAHNSPLLRFGFLKGFNDGVIESQTAFMLQAFEGSAETGKPLIAREKLFDLVEKAHARRFPVALHSIGDASVRLALDAYEAAIKKHPDIKLRHRIEHIEVIDPADLPRFRQLDVIASMQPFHANPGGPTPDDGVWSKNLGPARLKMSFAWRSLKDAGAPLAFGTDWPVMSDNPLWGLALATTRKDPNGQPSNGWNAHQTLTFNDAVDAFTRGSSYAVGEEALVGTLDVGQLADVVILGADVDPAQPATLWKGAVRTVILLSLIHI